MITVRPGSETVPPVTLIKASEIVVNGRHVTPGCELSISGLRGRCRFLAHVTGPRGDEWVDVVDARGSLRSFRMDRIRRVHQVAKMRAGAI